jgi:hypothetical protein
VVARILYDYYGSGAVGPTATFASFAVLTALCMSLTVGGCSTVLCSFLWETFLFPSRCRCIFRLSCMTTTARGAVGRTATFASFAVLTALCMSLTVGAEHKTQ